MSLTTKNRSDRVMVFMDLRNMTNGCKKEAGDGFRIDFKDMVDGLVDGRVLRGSYFFDSSGGSDGCDNSVKFHDRLCYLGFRPIIRQIHDEDIKGQKEVDVAMGCEMVKHAANDNYDVAIVLSGDRDFRPAVEMVQSMGKTVEIASFNSCVSPALVRAADSFYNLSEMCIIGPKESREIPTDGCTIDSDSCEEIDVEAI